MSLARCQSAFHEERPERIARPLGGPQQLVDAIHEPARRCGERHGREVHEECVDDGLSCGVGGGAVPLEIGRRHRLIQHQEADDVCRALALRAGGGGQRQRRDGKHDKDTTHLHRWFPAPTTLNRNLCGDDRTRKPLAEGELMQTARQAPAMPSLDGTLSKRSIRSPCWVCLPAGFSNEFPCRRRCSHCSSADGLGSGDRMRRQLSPPAAARGGRRPDLARPGSIEGPAIPRSLAAKRRAGARCEQVVPRRRSCRAADDRRQLEHCGWIGRCGGVPAGSSRTQRGGRAGRAPPPGGLSKKRGRSGRARQRRAVRVPARVLRWSRPAPRGHRDDCGNDRAQRLLRAVHAERIASVVSRGSRECDPVERIR